MAIYYDYSWIKLPRNFTRWQWYQNVDVSHLYLFLLLNANIEDEDKEGIKIRRGELFASLSYISIATGLSIQTIRTCLTKLSSTKEIEFRELGKGRVIIVVDFNRFQPIGADDEATNWIRLYRKICDWSWYKNQNMTHLFVHFMINANITVLPNGVTVAQCKCTLRKLNLETGLSLHCIRDCIEKMQKSGEISYDTSTSHTFSIVTICNYVDYQLGNTDTNTILTRYQHDTNTMVTQSTLRTTAQQKRNIKNCVASNYRLGNTDTNTMVTRYQHENQHDANTMLTRYQHDANTNNKEYKNIRKEEEKNIEFIDDDARTRERDFVEVEEVKVEQKENEQKKVEKESFSERVKSDERWMEAIMKRYHLRLYEVKQKLDDFELDLICRGKEEHKDEKDYKSHFCDWLTKLGTSQTKNSPSPPQSNQYPKERWPGEKYVPKSLAGYEKRF